MTQPNEYHDELADVSMSMRKGDISETHVLKHFIKEMHAVLEALQHSEQRLEALAQRITGEDEQPIRENNPDIKQIGGYINDLPALKGRLSGLVDRITKYTYQIGEFV